MAITKMSLHRIIAEIKAIEGRLAFIRDTSFVANATGEAKPENDAFVAESQKHLDKITSDTANLAALKAARNSANATVAITIGGKTLTIDQALAFKAALPYKQILITTLQGQLVRGQAIVDAAQVKIEDKVNSQVATMFSGTRKATVEELKMVRDTVERGMKVVLLHAPALKERVETLKNAVAAFTTEVDYVLSEANATSTVEVQMI